MHRKMGTLGQREFAKSPLPWKMWYCQVRRHRPVRAVGSSGVLRDVPSQLEFQDIAEGRHERVNPLCLLFSFLNFEIRGKETDKHAVYV